MSLPTNPTSIDFLIPETAPGIGGVGDYARQLAGHLNDRGWAARSVPWSVSDEPPPVGPEVVPEPAWVSWQFVCYAYARGVWMLPLVRRLRRRYPTAHLHLMVHELWPGTTRRAGPLERLTSACRARQLRVMVHRLNVRVIHTQIEFHRAWLRRWAIEASLLPLPGNIPIAAPADRPVLPSSPGEAADHRRWVTLGFFGSTYPNLAPGPFLQTIVEALRARSARPALYFFGRNQAPAIFEKWVQAASACGVPCHALGALSPERVSQAIQELDYGVATTPAEALGKSGSAMALLEHGLPLIAQNGDILPPTLDCQPESWDNVILVGNDLPARLAVPAPRRAPASRWPLTVDRLMAALGQTMAPSAVSP